MAGRVRNHQSSIKLVPRQEKALVGFILKHRVEETHTETNYMAENN